MARRSLNPTWLQARGQELFDKGFIAQAALDDAQKTIEMAEAQVRAAHKQLESTGIAGSDRALAVADVALARACAPAARARAGYAVNVAPLAGTLIARNVEVGDVVQPGTAATGVEADSGSRPTTSSSPP